MLSRGGVSGSANNPQFAPPVDLNLHKGSAVMAGL